MTNTATTNRPNAIVAMAALRAAASDCHDVLAEPGDDLIAEMLDTAAAAAEIAVRLLELAAPGADDQEPGTGEALERASELTADTHRHIVTAMYLAAGAGAITNASRQHQSR